MEQNANAEADSRSDIYKTLSVACSHEFCHLIKAMREL
jgi:hypothetical protein